MIQKYHKEYDLFDDGHHPRYKRCYESHKPLVISEGVQVYGGSCGSPIITDADIYVGLDLSHKASSKSFPWVSGESFLYHIRDMHAPADKGSFIKLIDWLAVQLTANKKAHIGCIGGHGRTGTVLAALVSVMRGEKDAIQYVRNNYCPKAVESEEQVEFLHSTFGISKVGPIKSHYTSSSRVTSHRSITRDAPKLAVSKSTEVPKNLANVTPSGKGGIWGSSVTFDK